MEHSSSSSSGLDEASMDESEQEHDSDYDLDDGSDDPHDDYDDLPEDDDDDDDVDDEIDGHNSHLPHVDIGTVAANALHESFFSQNHRFEPHSHGATLHLPRRLANIIEVDDFPSFPSNSLSGQEDFVRTVFQNVYDSQNEDQISRFMSHIDSLRVDHSNIFSRLRPTPISVTPRFLRHTPSAIHPHLHPPRLFPATSYGAATDFLSSIARRSSNIASMIDRTQLLAPAGQPTPLSRAQDALHYVTSLTGSSSSQEGQSPSSSNLVPPDYVPSSVPRTASGEPLTHLYEADLMRTVAVPPQSAPALAALTRSRRSNDLRPSRDTERSGEKVPHALASRWRYEPCIPGGDSLPSMFDPDANVRTTLNSFASPRSVSSLAAFGAQQRSDIPRPIAAAASKVTSVLEDMLVELWSISDTLTTAERKAEEERKKLEEKRKKGEEENQAKGSTSQDAVAQSSSGQSPAEMENAPSMTDDQVLEPPHDATDSGEGQNFTVELEQREEVISDRSPSIESRSGNESGELHDTEMEAADDPENESRSGDSNVMGSPEAEDQSTAVPNPTSPIAHPATSDSVPAADTDTRDGSDVESPDVPISTTNRFSAIATERAAAAGISLDAPANENPEIVAAATQSTGIDPAFLAALPEDMRTEILTQYYEQIRTNTNLGDSGSSSPPATSVNQDFLIALPPALRAEVLELEAEFQSRHRGGEPDDADEIPAGTNANDGPTSAAAEMDNATFLATLAPDLREEILLTSGEAFIESLPPNVAAEARVLREREMSSRMPWRVHVNDSGPRLESRDPGRRQGSFFRRGDRPTSAGIPSYKWKKVGDGWLREMSNVENEPKFLTKPEGIAAIVSLLWQHDGRQIKALLYFVLSHICKSSTAREVFLKEFFEAISRHSNGNLISDDSHGDKAVTPESAPSSLSGDRASFLGTAVHRALEVLTLVTKDDTVVAERLLGLPSTADEVKHIGEHTIEDGNHSSGSKMENNLSTLLSWISNKLFVRSVAHLEQLVTLISAISHAIPPERVKGDEKIHSRRMAGRSPLLDRSVVRNLNQTMNMLFIPEEDEGSGVMMGMRDDPVEGIVLDEGFGEMYDLTMGLVNNRSNGNRGENSGSGGNDETKKDDKGDVDADGIVPVRYRVPALQERELDALAKVLLKGGCTEKMYDRVAVIIGRLGELPENRLIFMRVLVSIGTDAGSRVRRKYVECLECLGVKGEDSSERAKSGNIEGMLSFRNGSDEMTLLRVVKSLSTLLNYNSAQINCRKGDTSERDNEDSKSDVHDVEVGQSKAVAERAFRESMVSGLQDVWAALDKLLVRVSDHIKPSKDRKGEPGTMLLDRGSTSAAAMMQSDRAKVGRGGLSPTLARLSPMIEAFLITHSTEDKEDKKVPKTEKSGGSDSSLIMVPVSVSSSSMASATDEGVGIDIVASEKSLDERLAVFVERHRVAINALLRANGSLLETTFKGALRHPHAIDFDNKKVYFRNVIRMRSSAAHAGAIRISVRRDRVFDDSYQQLRLRTPDEMKGRLHVQFAGEEGVDAGGVTREWYTILARQIFDPNYVLFTRSAAKAATYQPDKRSYINKEHLENFRFVGRIIGKAIYDGQLLDAYFTRSFYKHILGLKPTFHDIEAEDPEYYKSLKWMLENNIDGILDYTMSAEYDEFGKQTVVDLMPNGRNIPVTEENKALYVKLVTEVRMTKTIEKQIEAFKEGFYELIPNEDCRIFNEVELELLMSGLPDIDVSDLKANVEYTGYTSSSPQVNWFWTCVSKMGQEDLARLVMFVTGTSKVPLEGFGDLQGMNGVQKFQIHRVGGATMRLPSAHTCFNQLDLPEYSTAEILSERLLKAIRECNVGFGFA